MINSGKGLYEQAIHLGIEKDGCDWQNLNTPTQKQWEALAGSMNAEKQLDDTLAGFVASKNNKIVNESNVFLEGCPVYSRVTGSLLGHYIGKTRDGGCCIDSGDGVYVEPFTFVTSNEKDIEEFRLGQAIEQWELTIQHSNTTVLATYLANQNVKNPM